VVDSLAPGPFILKLKLYPVGIVCSLFIYLIYHHCIILVLDGITHLKRYIYHLFVFEGQVIMFLECDSNTAACLETQLIS
jgi:hypothetical protein